MRRLLMIGLAMAGFVSSAFPEPAPELNFFIGTYTSGDSEGIYRGTLDTESGVIVVEGLAAACENPSFLAAHPSKPILYAVGEGDGGNGKVLAFHIGLDGMLSPQSEQSSGGDHPCHLAVAASGDRLAVANYSSGSVAFFLLDRSGALGARTRSVAHKGSSIVKGRQDSAHAHSVDFDVSGRYLLSADLGIDQVITYANDLEDTVSETKLAPGSGPRHLAFHTSGGYVYVVNELSNTVTAFSFNATTGQLKEIQTLTTLPEGYSGENTTAEIAMHPTGDFVYASNRGHDSIAGFAINRRTGELKAIGHTATGGKTPRNFALSPDGNFLLAANQDSNDIHVFRVNKETGTLEATPNTVSVPAPVCILFKELPKAK